jgi:hypothetical protein
LRSNLAWRDTIERSVGLAWQFASPGCDRRGGYALATVPRTWIWLQVAIVFFVLIGMIIAVIRLA